MTPDQQKAWAEYISFYALENSEADDYYQALFRAVDNELSALRAERDRLREALRCTSENCSEFGHIHDGDCSACPQGIIRRRAYGEGE